MTSNRRFAEVRERLTRDSLVRMGFWENFIPFIKKGMVVPIISNACRIEQIFHDEAELSDQISDTPQYDDQNLTLDEQITKEWGDFIEYPMPDSHNLARVAQYYLVEQKDSIQARASYLDFLKTFLLTMNADDQDYGSLAKRLLGQVKEQRFSEIVRQLDYPRFPSGMTDPLRLLARLPLPIYVTTSYYNFLEQALEAEGKKPHTQVCFWSGARGNARPEHLPDPEFEPTPESPAVYHLFGLEDYPQTLVLSEDDYMNFLVAVVEDTNTQNPIIPLKLRQALAESHLLLMGYHLRDWDFRVLFRFIMKYRNHDSAPRGMVIQLKPGLYKIGSEEKSIDYLSHYFDKKQFDIEWTNAERFVYKLWDEWDKYRKGQK